MMKYTLAILISTMILGYSCKTAEEQQEETSGFDFKAYFNDIAKIDHCLGEGESFEVLGKRMDVGVKAPLDTIMSSSLLKQLYYEAHQRQLDAGPKTNGRCVDTNYAVKERVIQRLAIMATDETIQVLIDFYKDNKLPFKGGAGRSLTRAMIACGKPIVAKLEPIKNQRPLIGPVVIQSLQNQ